jgi:hypothetical protein
VPTAGACLIEVAFQNAPASTAHRVRCQNRIAKGIRLAMA